MRITSTVAATLLLSVTLVGCNDSGSATDPAPALDPYVTLRLNVRGATMSTVAPYNTLQLTAVGLTASGAAIGDADTVQYTTNDTLVTVSPTGLVTARGVTRVRASTIVVAKMHDRASDITHVDTAFIVVTSTVPASPMATFAIARNPGDSTRLAINDWILALPTDTLRVQSSAADGTNLTPLLYVRFSTSDSSIAKVSSTGIVKGLQAGTVTIYATSTYYGVTMRDSVQMRILDPMLAWITAETTLSRTEAGKTIRQYVPALITISVGGTVAFQQGDGELAMDVVFDDPTAAQPTGALLSGIVSWIGTGTGNIGPIPPVLINGQLNPACDPITNCTGGMRAFPRAGTYRYHSALYGTSGVITVR